MGGLISFSPGFNLSMYFLDVNQLLFQLFILLFVYFLVLKKVIKLDKQETKLFL